MKLDQINRPDQRGAWLRYEAGHVLASFHWRPTDMRDGIGWITVLNLFGGAGCRNPLSRLAERFGKRLPWWADGGRTIYIGWRARGGENVYGPWPKFRVGFTAYASKVPYGFR